MNDTLLIALVVAVIGPVILSILTNRQRRKEKAEDWKREDAVAEKAATAAEALRKDNKALAEATKEVAAVAAESKASTDFQLERIHTLVNSNMTAQMEDSLASKKAELAALLEVGDLKQASGQKPTEEALAVIATIRTDIARKEAELEDRLAATARAAAAAAAQAKEEGE
jgi:FtsZ-interacting cell division protein ZipA